MTKPVEPNFATRITEAEEEMWSLICELVGDDEKPPLALLRAIGMINSAAAIARDYASRDAREG